MGIINLTTFIITSFFFIISPGIDTMFILNKSIAQGKRIGMFSTFGIASGVLVHTTFAAFGLSLLLAQSAMAFNIIKYAGAVYLLYLGIVKLLARQQKFDAEPVKKRSSAKKAYLSAVVTNVLNPKVAIFFLAFFPQFIRPDSLHSPIPFVILGLLYAFMSLVWFAILTLFAGVFSHKLTSTPAIGAWMNKFSGLVFLSMGIKVALTKR